MRVKFYLSRPDAKEQTAIFASLSYNGYRVKIYTGENIDPKNWNSKTHSARNSPRFIEHPEFNRRLDNIRSTINRTLLKYKNDHNAIPAPADLKKLLAVSLGRSKEVKVTFQTYFTEFVQRQINGLRVNPKTKEPIKAAAAKHYQHTLNSIIAFAGESDRQLDWKAIDLTFYNDYTSYLTKSRIALNTIGAHIRRLKTVLNEAAAHGHEVDPAFKSAYFSVQSEAADNIYLTEIELEEMQSLDLSGNKRLEAVRDLFVVGCHSGLRFSDFSTLRASDIQNGFIKITQVKTGDKVTIPVHPMVQQIIDKYNGSLPAAITNQKTNAYLKEIGQLLPCLQAKASKQTTKGGVKAAVTLHRWEMLSTHTARRTFATLQYLKGVPSITIMACTGHRTESSFLKYIKVTSDEHAHKMKDIWADAARLKMKAV